MVRKIFLIMISFSRLDSVVMMAFERAVLYLLAMNGKEEKKQIIHS